MDIGKRISFFREAKGYSVNKYVHSYGAIKAVSYVDGKKWHKGKREIERLEAQMREGISYRMVRHTVNAIIPIPRRTAKTMPYFPKNSDMSKILFIL